MSENEGTYAALMQLQKEKRTSKSAAPQPPHERAAKLAQEKTPAEASSKSSEKSDDLIVTPYISQNYRFTDDELRWVRQQAFRLTERFGTKVTQNTILRVALSTLRDLCEKNPRTNPLLEAISRLKK